MNMFQVSAHRHRLGLLLLACAAVLALAPARAAAPAIKVFVASEASLNATSTLLLGEKDAVLVDVPFTRSDGHRLVAEVLESGRTLRTIYISHDHPDHFLSLEVLAQAFPDARMVTAAPVVDDIWRSLPFKLKRWGPMLGANGPRHPVVPQALQGDSLTLEGNEIRVLGPMQGDHVHATALWVPSISALIAGDLLFADVHLWLGEHTPDQRKAWLAVLDRFDALQPKIVVAGHRPPGVPDDARALRFTRDYLIAFESAVKSAKNSADLIARMKTRFPQARDYIDGFILNNSAQVAMGETPPWTE
jgi:glyoxylase-like metal-dependent hydrolase (beta-lactamase superfamily II)